MAHGVYNVSLKKRVHLMFRNNFLANVKQFRNFSTIRFLGIHAMYLLNI